jgi:hypothetical protein
VYDPSNGQLVAGAFLNQVDNGTYTYNYSNFFSYVDPAGAVDLLANVTVMRDSNNTVFAVKHFIRRYNLTGSLQWISPSFDEYADNIISYGSDSPTYTQINGYVRPLQHEQFDHLGNRSWITPGLQSAYTYPPVCDNNGMYAFYEDRDDLKKIHITRIDRFGNRWTTALASSVPSQITATRADAVALPKNLYVSIMLPTATVMGEQAVVQRYVQGVALSILSTSSTSYPDGSVIPVNVMLNSPALAGGIAVKLTTNSAKALFPNNTTSYTAAVPAGSTYAVVNVHTLAVTASTAVTVLGNQTGVQRACSFTITP